MKDLTATTLTMDIVIHPDDVAQYSNLGIEVTQKHMEYLVETYESIVSDNYFSDLFEALLIANERIAEDSE